MTSFPSDAVVALHVPDPEARVAVHRATFASVTATVPDGVPPGPVTEVAKEIDCPWVADEGVGTTDVVVPVSDTREALTLPVAWPAVTATGSAVAWLDRPEYH
jgi:hypothetical protein